MPRKNNKRTPKRNVSRKLSKGKRAKRKSTKKSQKSKKVKQVLTSTYGIGNLMKVDEKGYKPQRVAKKDKYKDVQSSGPYGLEEIFKEDQKGYKAQRVAKKDKYKKAKHPPIPSNIKGKKKRKKKSKTLTLPSMKSEMDSFLEGIDSKPSKKKGTWIEHVKNYWEERRKSEPGYKYKDAMKDAKKTW
tara:strand:+ start:250 stop:810 length:561 start_codon:yes stop_codon:yes gene_type:complete